MKRLKQTLALVLSCAVFTMCFSFAVFAAETEQIGDFVYTAGTSEIVDYVGTDTEIEIPEGYTLTKLGSTAKKQITKVTINDNESWGYMSLMPNVTEVIFGNSVTELPKMRGDSSPVEKVTLSDNITEIDNGVFTDCPISEINIPKSLEYIGEAAFYNSNLSGDLVFPDSLKYIGAKAFRSDSGENVFSSVTLPNNIEYVAPNAFDDGLSEINYPSSFLTNPPEVFPDAEMITFTVDTDSLSAKVLKSLEDTSWYKNVYLNSDSDFVVSDNELITYKGDDSVITVPEGITTIAESAFENLDCAKIILPDSLKYIEEFAFMGCAIEEITIPKNVKSVASNAFTDCSALKKVVFDGAPEIQSDTFVNCISLTKDGIVFKDSSVSIPDELYDNITSYIRKSVSLSEKTSWGANLIDYVDDDCIVLGYSMTKAEYLKALANGALATAEPSKTTAPDATAEPTSEPESTDKPSATVAPKTTAEPSETAEPSQLTVTTNGGNIGVAFGGKPIEFTDASPFIDENDRTQAPVRAIAEALGCTVEWNGATQTATITGGGTVITITIGNPTITVNGEPAAIDTAARIVNDRTYIPVRALAEALGATVTWGN